MRLLCRHSLFNFDSGMGHIACSADRREAVGAGFSPWRDAGHPRRGARRGPKPALPRFNPVDPPTSFNTRVEFPPLPPVRHA